MFEPTSQVRPESDDGYNNSKVHLITSNNKVRESSERTNPLAIVTEVSLKGWEDVAHQGRSTERLGVCPLKVTVHHIINTERSIPDNRSVHNVPLDDTLVAADDFLLPALAHVLELGRTPDELFEELTVTVISTEMYEKNGYVVSPSP